MQLKAERRTHPCQAGRSSAILLETAANHNKSGPCSHRRPGSRLQAPRSGATAAPARGPRPCPRGPHRCEASLLPPREMQRLRVLCSAPLLPQFLSRVCRQVENGALENEPEKSGG